MNELGSYACQVEQVSSSCHAEPFTIPSGRIIKTGHDNLGRGYVTLEGKVALN